VPGFGSDRAREGALDSVKTSGKRFGPRYFLELVANCDIKSRISLISKRNAPFTLASNNTASR
jgi:hypothetical protein